MQLSFMKWSVAFLLAVILAGEAAKASTIIHPGDVTSLTVGGNNYQASAEPGANGVFTNDYYFKVIVDTTVHFVGSLQTPAGFTSANIKNLTVQWVGGPSTPWTDSNGAGTIFSSASGFSLIPPDVFLAASSSLYLLRITGEVVLGGRYNFDITASTDGSHANPVDTVPLPPALILFGSALVGLGVLGRRKRQGAAV